MIYAYLRVSTDKQDENNQRLGVDEKAKELGVQFDKYYIEHVSGITDPEERVLGKLLKKVKENDMIIISEISRLGRKLFMLFTIMDKLLEKKVKVYSVKEGWSLDSSLQSKVMAFAYGMSAEIERDMIASRTKEALERRKAMGIKLGRKKGAKVKNHKLINNEAKIKRMLAKGYSQLKICRIIKMSPKTLRKYINEQKQKEEIAV